MIKFSCSTCGAVWQKEGKTNCWSSNPAETPAKPGHCPSRVHMETINESFELYKGEGEDAKIARVATRVEGLCYEHVDRQQCGSCPAEVREWSRREGIITPEQAILARS